MDDTESRLRTSADGRITVLELAVPFPAPSAEAISSLDRIRQNYLTATFGALAGVEAAVGSEPHSACWSCSSRAPGPNG